MRNAALLTAHATLTALFLPGLVVFLSFLGRGMHGGVQARMDSLAILAVYGFLLASFFAAILLMRERAAGFLSRSRPDYAFLLSLLVLFTATSLQMAMSLFFRQCLVFGFSLCVWLYFAWSSGRSAPSRFAGAVLGYVTLACFLLTLFVILWSETASFIVLHPLLIFAVPGAFVPCCFLWWALRRPPSRSRTAFLAFSPVLLALFFLCFFMESRISEHHYGFFLGPVIEVLYGNRHPLTDLFSQYGGGLTAALSSFFRLIGFVSPDAFLLLLKTIFFLGYLLLFWILTTLYRSRLLAALALAGILTLSFFTQGVGVFGTPSTGFLRFGHFYLILAFFTLEKEYPRIPRTVILWAVAAVMAVATLWSFECMVYAVFPVVGLCILLRDGKSFVSLTLRFIVLLALFSLPFILPPLLHGQTIHLLRYYQYPLLYAEGFGSISLYDSSLIWILFPLVYVLFLLRNIFE